jgi:hypothetical protein
MLLAAELLLAVAHFGYPRRSAALQFWMVLIFPGWFFPIKECEQLAPPNFLQCDLSQKRASPTLADKCIDFA